MATPYPNVSNNGYKDDYNFYHSQLRINIECAFGMLVSRWGILRTPLSSRFTIGKIIGLVLCLGRLHNFLIDVGIHEESVLDHTPKDELQIHVDGGIQMNVHYVENKKVLIPDSFLGACEHLNNPKSTRKRVTDRTVPVPRETISEMIREKHYKRPRIKVKPSKKIK